MKCHSIVLVCMGTAKDLNQFCLVFRQIWILTSRSRYLFIVLFLSQSLVLFFLWYFSSIRFIISPFQNQSSSSGVLLGHVAPFSRPLDCASAKALSVHSLDCGIAAAALSPGFIEPSQRLTSLELLCRPCFFHWTRLCPEPLVTALLPPSVGAVVPVLAPLSPHHRTVHQSSELVDRALPAHPTARPCPPNFFSSTCSPINRSSTSYLQYI